MNGANDPPRHADVAGPEAFVIYTVGERMPSIVPASHERSWMSSESAGRVPYRCLPLVMANSSGWLVLNEGQFTARWDGGAGRGATRLLFEHRRSRGDYHAASIFGHGIVTFTMPFLVRTAPGFNLLVRGPANTPRDGAAALEGIVETDWAVATFTMNWQITRRGSPITFGADEPICMLVPQRRGELSSFSPTIRPLADDAALAAEHEDWRQGREQFRRDLNRSRVVSPGPADSWQRHYFQGITPSGKRAAVHETRLRLSEPSRPGDGVGKRDSR